MDNSPIKVLFIDDDEDDYILTRYWFSEFQVADCELEWVNNYEAARNAIARHQHDVYLVDYRLGATQWTGTFARSNCQRLFFSHNFTNWSGRLGNRYRSDESWSRRLS